MDISPIDLINIESFANRVIHLFEYRKSLQEVRRSPYGQALKFHRCLPVVSAKQDGTSRAQFGSADR